MSPQVNEGYVIIESIVIGNARFVIGENLKNPVAPYVTWQANIKNDPDNFFWGHYYAAKLDAVADFGKRITEEAESLLERTELKKTPKTREKRGEER